LAKPIPLEMGKPFRETQGEVDFSAGILNLYADNAEKFLAPDRSMRRRGPVRSGGGVPLDRSPEDLQEVGN
jgi:acyl-CoA reductase-like NAD-dependent aldehyde dehydrogenase